MVSIGSVSAQAQSSVTLYGVVDAGFAYTNNQGGASNIQQTSGKLSGSRWGLKGVEDLGGGVQAVFTLESGFRPSDGGPARAAACSAAPHTWASPARGGTLTFGRQYEPITDLVAQYSGSGFWSPATHVGDNDNMNQSFRLNNAVKFRSDTIAGFTADLLYAFSNQANGGAGTGFSNNNAWGASANYVNGPLSVGAGYVRINHPNSTSNTSGAVGGATSTTGNDYSGGFFYGLNGGVLKQQIGVVGANYALGAATLGFAWSHTQLDYLDGSSRKFNNYDVNARYQLTPAATLIGVTFTDGRASGLPGTGGQTLKPRWHQFTLGFDYALSKRTDIYLSGIYQLAAGDASTATSGGYRKIAAISNIGSASSTNRQARSSLGCA